MTTRAMPHKHSDLSPIQTLPELFQYRCQATPAAEAYRSFDATNDGHRYADKLESPIDDLRRDAHRAIADILGRARTTVELI